MENIFGYPLYIYEFVTLCKDISESINTYSTIFIKKYTLI
jgi:hypothetical protein